MVLMDSFLAKFLNYIYATDTCGLSVNTNKTGQDCMFQNKYQLTADHFQIHGAGSST